MPMEIIVGGRRSGKTRYLMDRMRKEPDLILVVQSSAERRTLIQQYSGRGIRLGERTFTVDELRNRDRGRPAGSPIVIENLDVLLYKLLNLSAFSRIEAATITADLTKLIGGPRDPRTGI